MEFNDDDFYPVEVTYNTQGLSVIGDFPCHIISPIPAQLPLSLQEMFYHLPQSSREILGSPVFKADNGETLLDKLRQSNKVILGASDASLKLNRATHAWILSSGDVQDITNPLLNISGTGPVHGHPQYLSSSRGELQGVTALSIMASLLSTYYDCSYHLAAICDNKGVLSKGERGSFNSSRSQCQANIDLFSPQRKAAKSLGMTFSLVKGHMDKQPWQSIEDLKLQKLSRDEIYNIWCNRVANEAWHNTACSLFDPDVAPLEKWAIFSVYPTYHKITGQLDHGVYSTLGYEDLLNYISKKHLLTPSKLDKTNVIALQGYLSSLKTFQRVSMAKMIHNWIPTYSKLC
jgi:hypothetical protein